jgi:small-conductance mechanosensitive channel/CRP-like cAMP-binding protein
MILGLVLLVAALALRGAHGNRYVRGRLLVSSGLFAADALASAVVAYARPSPDVSRLIDVVGPLLLALGLINALVALAINPWRSDRMPDRFPNIVQDTMVIALFGIAATLILRERILATTAVGAVVIGFALQDTLGNLFAGLAIQIEKPFRVGQWVNLAGKDGLVSEITWRATKIRTKTGNFVIVPNSTLSRETITNYSEPMLDTRVEVEVGVSYDAPPNQVKAVIAGAIRDEPLLAPGRDPEVLIADFAPSAITYRIRVWTSDFAADEQLRDHVRSRVYYALRRANFEIPFPMQVEIRRDASGPPAPGAAAFEAALGGVEILAALSTDERRELARGARLREYAVGEAIVRQGDPGSSMFVIYRGDATVTLGLPKREIARLGSGQFFGEMSLLTGEPRAATVAAATDCSVLEITVEDFRRLVLADPEVVERVAGAVAARRVELERHIAEGAVSAASTEPPQSFVARVRRFLRLASS